MRVIKENSNRYRKMNKGLFGDPSGKVRTFAIISPENPLGWKDSTEEEFKEKYLQWTQNPKKYNKEAKEHIKTKELLHEIKKTGDMALQYSGAQYIPIFGSFGEKERSYFILNISLKDAFVIARDYGQISFFFGKVYSDYSHIAYYKTYNGCKTYKLVEISDTVEDKSDAEDFFSRFGRQFSINMREFGNEVTPVENEDEFDRSLEENSTFMSRAMHRRNSRNNG